MNDGQTSTDPDAMADDTGSDDDAAKLDPEELADEHPEPDSRMTPEAPPS
jgi:hypothetical protein